MQAQQIAITLKTQVLDRIYAQYGVKAVDLQRAIAHYKLDNDPDVESIKKAKITSKTVSRALKLLKELQIKIDLKRVS